MLSHFPQFHQTAVQGGVLLFQNPDANTISLQLLLHVLQHIPCAWERDSERDRERSCICTAVTAMASLHLSLQGKR